MDCLNIIKLFKDSTEIFSDHMSIKLELHFEECGEIHDLQPLLPKLDWGKDKKNTFVVVPYKTKV